jgi:hypothetical protein
MEPGLWFRSQEEGFRQRRPARPSQRAAHSFTEGKAGSLQGRQDRRRRSLNHLPAFDFNFWSEQERAVILSAAGTSRSEVPAESKDPYTLSSSGTRQGVLPAPSTLPDFGRLKGYSSAGPEALFREHLDGNVFGHCVDYWRQGRRTRSANLGLGAWTQRPKGFVGMIKVS